MMNMGDGSMNISGSMSMGNNPMGSMGQGGQMQGMTDPNTMGGMAANHGFFGSQTTTTGLGNLDFTSILSGILNFAVELFAILLIVGFIVALVVFIKRNLFDGNLNLNINRSKVVCTKCGNTLHSDWNCCPKCGAAKYNPQTNTTN